MALLQKWTFCVQKFFALSADASGIFFKALNHKLLSQTTTCGELSRMVPMDMLIGKEVEQNYRWGLAIGDDNRDDNDEDIDCDDDGGDDDNGGDIDGDDNY